MCSSLFVSHIIMLCTPDSQFGVISLHLSHFLKFVLNLFGRNRSQETDDHVHNQANQECRKKLVDSKCATHRTDKEFPYKYHNSTADHTSQCTLQSGAFPEQCHQNQWSEGSTETCPCKGYNLEYRAVRISCDKYTDQSNDQNGDTRDQHTGLLTHILHKYFFQNILRSAGGCRQKLRICG